MIAEHVGLLIQAASQKLCQHNAHTLWPLTLDPVDQGVAEIGIRLERWIALPTLNSLLAQKLRVKIST